MGNSKFLILGLGWVIVVFDGLFVFVVKFGVVLVQIF